MPRTTSDRVRGGRPDRESIQPRQHLTVDVLDRHGVADPAHHVPLVRARPCRPPRTSVDGALNNSLLSRRPNSRIQPDRTLTTTFAIPGVPVGTDPIRGVRYCRTLDINENRRCRGEE